MRILGIESSCDETAAAIVQDGTTVLSHVIHSQIDIHQVYGGVVPEVAARSHLEVMLPVIDEAFSNAKSNWNDIDAIAVANTPGLIGSLLIGVMTARTLAILKHKPLFPVHHVEGHVYANFITKAGHGEQESGDSERPKAIAFSFPLPKSQPRFPLLALIISGLHTQLVLFKTHGDYELLGMAQDDAVGEAFDKVARLLGLPSPGGGQAIARAAMNGDPFKYQFPIARMSGSYDFSFSGLKTAVLRAIQAECGVGHDFPSFNLAERLNDRQRSDFAASFQHTAVQTLVQATKKAYLNTSPATVVIAGGVAANHELRRQLTQELPLPIAYAPIELCTDNAVMIASLGYFMSAAMPASDPYSVQVIPSLSMSQTAWHG